MQSEIFNEIDLKDSSVAEQSTKNVNCSFSVSLNVVVSIYKYMHDAYPIPCMNMMILVSTLLVHIAIFRKTAWNFVMRSNTKLSTKWTKRVVFNKCMTPLPSLPSYPRLIFLQIIGLTHCLILCAESRKKMDEWISAIKAVQNNDFVS